MLRLTTMLIIIIIIIIDSSSIVVVVVVLLAVGTAEHMVVSRFCVDINYFSQFQLRFQYESLLFSEEEEEEEEEERTAAIEIHVVIS